jgi:hypothetical protein
MTAARFEESADQLADPLNTDIGWVRQHTDFGEKARRWTAASEPSGLPLRLRTCLRSKTDEVTVLKVTHQWLPTTVL